ncbi:hypothetical protein [Streptomyces goshikiensis]|uniref:hypothetical protein n=1 Tax=Streptomyces goshikiensis TaxID=1942 RepID=UPI00365CBA0D
MSRTEDGVKTVPLTREVGTFTGCSALALTATGNGLAIREFNARVRADDRVESVLLPIADGLTVARKRPTPARAGARA